MTIAAVKGAGTHSPLIDTVRQAYQSLGFQVEVVTMPALRAIRQAENSLVYDAFLAFDEAGGKSLPSYIPIKAALKILMIGAYARQDIRLSKWSDLDGLKVAHVRGHVSIANNLAEHPALEVVHSVAQAMSLLERGRVDVVVAPSTFAEQAISQAGYQQIRQVAVLEQKALYHFLHRKHAVLEHRLTAAMLEAIRVRAQL